MSCGCALVRVKTIVIIISTTVIIIIMTFVNTVITIIFLQSRVTSRTDEDPQEKPGFAAIHHYRCQVFGANPDGNADNGADRGQPPDLDLSVGST